MGIGRDGNGCGMEVEEGGKSHWWLYPPHTYTQASHPSHMLPHTFSPTHLGSRGSWEGLHGVESGGNGWRRGGSGHPNGSHKVVG